MSPTPSYKLVPAGEGRAYSVLGDRYTIVMDGTETAGAWALLDLEIAPGSGAPPHRHTREDEAFYIVAGDLTVNVGAKILKAGPGSFLSLPKNVPHFFQNTGGVKARVLVTIWPAGLENLFVETGHLLPSRHAPLIPVSPADIDRLKALAPKYGLELLPPPGVGP